MPTIEDMCDRIIWSADVANLQTLAVVLDEISHPIWVKLDRLFTRQHGDEAFTMVRRMGHHTFNDAKLIEIPSKLEELAMVECTLTKPDMLNCMAGCVSNGNYDDLDRELDGLKRFADICNYRGVAPCAVTVLTSKTNSVVNDEFGCNSNNQVLYYVMQLIDAGFSDVVCSPLEAEMISQHFGGRIRMNTPGIRMPENAADDQARVDTPGNAVANGVHRVVIGRPITNSDDPRATVEAIAADMLSAA
ncbi:orotidine 5'-phosphate decarboxylase [Candidatus Saccharibacteria bacterium]|nr:orotidine 5'-phosphate decarboxylase [Candidatus Saccharibacteria bacterium]